MQQTRRRIIVCCFPVSLLVQQASIWNARSELEPECLWETMHIQRKKISKFTISVQNIPLALSAQTSQIVIVGLTLFRTSTFANLL